MGWWLGFLTLMSGEQVNVTESDRAGVEISNVPECSDALPILSDTGEFMGQFALPNYNSDGELLSVRIVDHLANTACDAKAEKPRVGTAAFIS